MGKNWTAKQLEAINTRGKTLLISAAAGSGKTATLTERIVRRLTDPDSPASISKMLIVTFTRLSASDLKRKISAAISAELAKSPTSRHLSHQLVLLENASICTIDSFYLDVVRSNFQRIGLPSSFRIADEGEMSLLCKRTMDTVIGSHYDDAPSGDDSFLLFVEGFTSAKQSDSLSDVLLSLHPRLSSSVEGIDLLSHLADELGDGDKTDFFLTRQGKIIRSHLLSGARGYYSAICRCCDIVSSNEKVSASYLAGFASDKQFFADLCTVLESGGYTEVREKFNSFSKKKLSALKSEFQTDEVAMCKEIRTEAHKFITSAGEKYFSLDEDSLAASMKRTAEILTSLHEIFAEFDELVLAEKISRRCFDFTDIRQFAYKILSNADGSPSDVALSYRERFDEIYIDEYQDVDAVQDRIFSLISRGNNRFMVGDIKQSIYSFRGADTDVFAGYKTTLPPLSDSEGSDGALIFMSNNFRCDLNVIKFTNKIFSFLFGYTGESIGYTPEDDLIFSKLEEGRTLPSPKVNITIITPSDDKDTDDDDDDSDSPEARWIANEALRLIENEKNADGTKIEPRDIAVIMRTSTDAPAIMQAMRRVGIPCSDNSKYELFETPNVLLVISLLSAIDNPHKDIPLAASLYSPLFGYTMDDLLRIRSAADRSASLFEALRSYSGDDAELREKNEYFLQKLSDYRRRAASLPVDKLLNYVYRDLSLLSLEADSSQNLTKLYEMARKFEASSFRGLNNFISYINELIENDSVPKLTQDDADANAVKLITVHKSKGLEFPVCFICGTHRQINLKDTLSNILYHSRAGIALKLPYVGGMVRLNTPMREAVALSIVNLRLEEEMRILYVALTRARERLYITGISKNPDSMRKNARIRSEFPSDYRIKTCRSWLSLILAAIYPLRDGDGYTYSEIYDCEVDNIVSSEISGVISGAHARLSEEELATVRGRLEYSYPHAHLGKLPAKLSVSKLTPTVLDDIDNDAATLDSADEVRILEIEEFLAERSAATAADKGTATHLFLQFCDFENAERLGVRAELDRLTEQGFIAQGVAELINIRRLERFFESKFYAEFKHAKRIFREQRFNILLPASHFSEDEQLKQEIEDEQILVQGVIDLFFETEDGKIILCDYKTDHLTPEEIADPTLAAKKLAARHATQLSYYSMAVEKLIGRKPDKVLIYSLPLGESVEIKIPSV